MTRYDSGNKESDVYTITRNCADLNHRKPGWEGVGVGGGG